MKIGILLISLVLAALVVWKLVLPDYHKKKYVRMVLWSILALGFVSAGIQGPTTADKKAASSSSAQSSSKAKSSSKKESSTKTSSASSSSAQSNSKKESSTKTSSASSSSSKKKTSSINNKLSDELALDQGWANGTLDKDGNHVQNGEKFPQYNWATHVERLLWRDDNIEVYIADADQLSNAQLTTIAQSAQSAATSVLYDNGKIDDSKVSDGVFTTVYSGNKAIGHSKVFSPKEFKWTD
ncbi:hypothetical protein [Limosilactobacillus mucosae]|uniref:hypothetical protein n=1 Tax=Limosilactobacillus mucosae TaxID=97478 RepID=UPI003D054192